MRIHALTTGTVRLKRSFLFPSSGVRRQLDLFLPGQWSEPMPIHCWAIEHDGRLLLIDSGESADAIAPDPKVHEETLEKIMAHCAEQPTVFLPSHDPGSVARLADAVTV